MHEISCARKPNIYMYLEEEYWGLVRKAALVNHCQMKVPKWCVGRNKPMHLYACKSEGLRMLGVLLQMVMRLH